MLFGCVFCLFSAPLSRVNVQLAIRSLDAPCLGWYEGNDTVNREFRMFMSCPDVDALEQKLEPWLKHLRWPASVFVVKRFGKMHDVGAAEDVRCLRAK